MHAILASLSTKPAIIRPEHIVCPRKTTKNHPKPPHVRRHLFDSARLVLGSQLPVFSVRSPKGTSLQLGVAMFVSLRRAFEPQKELVDDKFCDSLPCSLIVRCVGMGCYYLPGIGRLLGRQPHCQGRSFQQKTHRTAQYCLNARSDAFMERWCLYAKIVMTR